MHHRIISLLALLWIACAPAAPAQTNSGALLPIWKVEGAKTNTVYLMGSVHLLKASDYPLDPAFDMAYTNSSVCAFETDIERMSRPATQFELMSKAALPAGETLKDQLSPAVYEAFQSRLKSFGLPPAMFEQMKPAIGATILAVAEMQKLGADPTKGIDHHFHQRARRDGKRIVSLETVEFQIGLITGFSKSEGEEFLKSLLEQIDEVHKVYADVVNAWKNGDSAKLEKVLNESMSDAPALYAKFLTDRNKRWVPQIERLLESGTNAVVIVGAAHLIGTDGVVDLLKKKGRKVSQVGRD